MQFLNETPRLPERRYGSRFWCRSPATCFRKKTTCRKIFAGVFLSRQTHFGFLVSTNGRRSKTRKRFRAYAKVSSWLVSQWNGASVVRYASCSTMGTVVTASFPLWNSKEGGRRHSWRSVVLRWRLTHTRPIKWKFHWEKHRPDELYIIFLSASTLRGVSPFSRNRPLRKWK